LMEKQTSFNKLTKEEEKVILYGGTEFPFTGEYYNNFKNGMYVCKRCGNPLYRSSDKFESDCGWPSFDDEVDGAIRKLKDADGMRTEIRCANCDAHLGHIFYGEKFTPKDTRHCVNSISMKFIPDEL
ncbi:MAG: methionine-R-sulfoxide reductase, partial [Thermoplasmatales archaeon]